MTVIRLDLRAILRELIEEIRDGSIEGAGPAEAYEIGKLLAEIDTRRSTPPDHN